MLDPELRPAPPYTEWTFSGDTVRVPEFSAPALGAGSNVTCPIAFSVNECLDIGVALGSPVSPDYYDKAPFKFTGTIERVYVACVIPK